MNKYLNYDEIKALIGEIIIDKNFSTMSQDSYNETLIGQKIVETGKSSELCMAAINLAVIGYGNQKYGTYRFGSSIIDIAQLFKSCGVRFNLPINSLLREDELTPQRLCRFFRYNIREYIEINKVATYLWRKYSHRDAQFNSTLFRGAEYLDDLSEDQINELLFCYETMDNRLNTRITDRVTRILEAKGKIKII
jgi:hypothetical protein